MARIRLRHLVAGLLIAVVVVLGLLGFLVYTMPDSDDTSSIAADVILPNGATLKDTDEVLDGNFQSIARKVAEALQIVAPSPPPPAKDIPLPESPPTLNGSSFGERSPVDARCYIFHAAPDQCAPHFVIIGALKSGTTSVYSYLSKHAEVVFRGPMSEDDEPEGPNAEHRGKGEPAGIVPPLRYKETGHFAGGPLRDDAHIASYMQYFPVVRPGGGLVTGEGSVQYIFSGGAPANLRTWLPFARYILLLRNPIERAFSRLQHSATLHLTRKQLVEPVRRAFRELTTIPALASATATQFINGVAATAIRSITVCLGLYNQAPEAATPHQRYIRFERCVSASKLEVTLPRLAEDKELTLLSARDSLNRHPAAVLQPEETEGLGPLDFMPQLTRTFVHLQSMQSSLYYPQVANWLFFFSDSQFRVWRSEDLFARPAEVMGEVAAFIGLGAVDWGPIVGTKYNVLRDKAGVVTLVAEAPTVAKQYPIDPAVRARLVAFYAPHNEALGKLLNRDFQWT